MGWLRHWQLSRRLRSPKWELRAEAVRLLRDHPDPDNLSLLMPALSDQHPKVRYAAGEALVRLGEPAIPPVTRALRTGDAQLRETAIWVLAQMGHLAVGALVEALRDKEKTVRRLAAFALADIGDLRALEPLLAAIKDWDPEVRTAVVHALGRMWEPAVGPLTGLLKDWNCDVRAAAAEALGQMRARQAVGSLVELLTDKEGKVRAAATAALGRIGGRTSAEALVEKLRSISPEHQKGVIQALLQLGDAAREPLAATLEDDRVQLRATAAEILGDLGQRRAVEPLLAVLSDESMLVRHAAAQALAKLEWEPSSPLEQARFAVARQNWDQALAAGPAAIEPLMEVVGDIRRQVRLGAARALGHLRATAAVEVLIPLLRDDYDDVANAAAEALGRIGDVRAVDALAAMIDHPKHRYAAARALGAIRAPAAAKALIHGARYADPRLHQQIRDGLLGIGSQASEPLLASLEHHVADVRRLAAEALGAMREARARVPLQALANDVDEAVQHAAREAIDRLGSMPERPDPTPGAARSVPRQDPHDDVRPDPTRRGDGGSQAR